MHSPRLDRIPRVGPRESPSPGSCKSPHGAPRASVLSPPATTPPDEAPWALRILLYTTTQSPQECSICCCQEVRHAIKMAWRIGEEVPDMNLCNGAVPNIYGTKLDVE